MKRVALITGSNRGLGRALCLELASQGIRVAATARRLSSLDSLLREIKEKGGEAEGFEFDVREASAIPSLIQKIHHQMNRIDILVNNAGVLLEPAFGSPDSKNFHVTADILLETFRVNTLAPFLLCQEVLPIMKAQGYGRIVNVSSLLGQLSSMSGDLAAYRVSKAALNAVTKIFAGLVKPGEDILVNSVTPGWVRTQMGGDQAPLSVEEGIKAMVLAATLPAKGPQGEFFEFEKSLDW